MSSRMSSFRSSTIDRRRFIGARRREPDRPRRRAGAAVRRVRPGPALERRRPVLAGRRLRRAAAGRFRAVDAACARSAVARSGGAGRHDRRRRAGDLRDRRRSGDARHRAPRHRDRRAHVRLFRACRCARTAAGTPLLVPLHLRRCREPDRPRDDARGSRHAAGAHAVRFRLLLQLRAGLFCRLPPSRRRESRCRAVSRRLHLRICRAGPPHRAHPFGRRRSGDAADLPQPLCAVPARPRPAAPARRGARARHLGRPRGIERLCRQVFAILRGAGAVPAAPRRRLPGVLRAHAGAADPVAAERPGDAGL